MMPRHRQPIGAASAKMGWRARGFEDGSAGRPQRSTEKMGNDVNVAAYREGYRIGKRERDREAK